MKKSTFLLLKDRWSSVIDRRIDSLFDDERVNEFCVETDGLFFDIETDNLILRCESIEASIKILDNIKQYNNLILRKIQYTKTDSSVHLYITALRS